MKILFDATELSYFLEESGHRAGVFFVALNLFRELKKRKDVELVFYCNFKRYYFLKEVIEKIDDIVIMNSCLCRTSNNCKDYPQDIGCIFLGPTSRKIPQNLCHKASKKEAQDHVDKADAAGLSHIIGRNKIDSIWMNVKPKEGLLTICHCCPCCCLWKVIPQLDDKISDKMHKLDGVEIAIDNSKCIDCMKCLNEICMSEAISFKDNAIQINQNKCRGCGLCVNICKQNAITLKYNDKSIDSIVNKLQNLVEL